ncbi:MAG TPA: SpoIID/LytB domain-containing protein, partial [Kofleriaceae bacterium]|nr:SpoIID/LytB domain-containing protein [Kofleriaceae bacterium]
MCHPRASAGVIAALLAAGAALTLTATARADGPADPDDDGDVAGASIPADELPLRWRTGVALGDDRSGDLRPEAAAILDAARTAADRRRVLTLADARDLGLAGIAAARPRPAEAIEGGPADAGPTTVAFDAPATIKVWRRGVDGSTASCSGRVDTIPFEKYVKGVLPHEWIRSWDAASLQAGAVAIRTYAAYWVKAGGKYDCADLDDTTASQVYKDEFFPVSDAAVDATADVFAVKNGDLVFAEYSAENGDPTATGVSEPLCTGRAVQGHGRGTCQWGTQRWAQNGKTFDWIVTHYYPGAMLTQVGPALAATLGAADHALTMTSGDEAVVWVEYTNTGRTTWTPQTVLLGTTGPRDRASPFVKAENWVDPTRPTGVDHTTAPMAVGRFTFAMIAPEVDHETTFTESFALVTSDGQWFGPADDAVTWIITVEPRTVDPGMDPDGTGGSADGGCAAGGGRAGLGLLLGVGLVGLVIGLGRRRRGALAVVAIAGLAASNLTSSGCAPGGEAPARRTIAVGGASELAAVFRQVGAESGVPPAILAATAYAQTRLSMIVPSAAGHGPAAWGLFALTDDDLARGAALAGETIDAAR